MKERLEAIKKAALEKIEQADAMDSLNDIRVSVLGKKGELTQVLKGMKDVAKEERPIVGQMVNDTRAVIEEALEKEMTLLKKKVREEKMKREVIDVTLPGKTHEKGHRHPNQIALEDLERVFIGMGYEVVEGPEVEYDKYNFEMLNIPANHPAKDEQDTFYINKDIVLRTQTSPVQARVMEQAAFRCGADGCPQHCGHHGQRRHPDPGHRHRLRSHRAGVPVRCFQLRHPRVSGLWQRRLRRPAQVRPQHQGLAGDRTAGRQPAAEGGFLYHRPRHHHRRADPLR